MTRKDSISFSSFLRIRTCPLSGDGSDWITESWKVEAVPLESPFASSAVVAESEDPGSVKFLQVVLGDVSDSGSGLPPCCIMSDEVAM